jgi:hypothetical protein
MSNNQRENTNESRSTRILCATGPNEAPDKILHRKRTRIAPLKEVDFATVSSITMALAGGYGFLKHFPWKLHCLSASASISLVCSATFHGFAC